MKRIHLFFVLLLASYSTQAQYNYRDSNHIGISFGINQFSLSTSNFQVKDGSGINGGLSVRGNFYNDFDMVYGIMFSENHFSVASLSPKGVAQDVAYRLPSAQISLQLSYKLIESHLSVEVGPMLQINGKLSSNSDYDKNTLLGTTLKATDITEISTFNFYPCVGITGGVTHFRLNLQYQYGVNNMLSNLNSKPLGVNFNGHGSIVTACLILYL